MNSFQIGKEYTSKEGVPCKILNINGDLMTIRYRFVQKKVKKLLYAGVEAAIINFGKDMLLSDKIIPVEDPEIDNMFCSNKNDIKINTHGESYVSLFKKHQKQETSANEDH